MIAKQNEIKNFLLRKKRRRRKGGATSKSMQTSIAQQEWKVTQQQQKYNTTNTTHVYTKRNVIKILTYIVPLSILFENYRHWEWVCPSVPPNRRCATSNWSSPCPISLLSANRNKKILGLAKLRFKSKLPPLILARRKTKEYWAPMPKEEGCPASFFVRNSLARFWRANLTWHFWFGNPKRAAKAKIIFLFPYRSLDALSFSNNRRHQEREGGKRSFRSIEDGEGH